MQTSVSVAGQAGRLEAKPVGQAGRLEAKPVGGGQAGRLEALRGTGTHGGAQPCLRPHTCVCGDQLWPPSTLTLMFIV